MLRWSLVYVFAIMFLMASSAAGWFMFTTRQAVRETEAIERTMAKQQDNRNEMRTKLRQALSELQTAKQNLNSAQAQLESAQTTRRDAAARLAAAKALNRGLENKLALAQQKISDRATPQTGAEGSSTRSTVLSQISTGAKNVANSKTAPKAPPAPAKKGAALAVKKPAIVKPAVAAKALSRTITSSLNVRAKPAVSATLVTTFEPGQKITVTTDGSPRGWHKLTGPANIAGYIKTTALMANSR